ncbi:hypothetical protein [Sediminivirga luteola]|uniref:Uncharacterized protein n=1 Tax=Sediminivirga luteola TaxID=1774748 RepID=A0A8J2TXB4_9MICO|nr:hypothetical protein [Sediminivirga luteola]GGA11072.1 hypothetical protein GCM10011333_12400 [Sediminivirga luteola]
MGVFTYGSGEATYRTGLNDECLQALELLICEAYALHDAFRVVIATDEHTDVLFVTQGVPLQIHYDAKPDVDAIDEDALQASKKTMKDRAVIVVGGTTVPGPV